MQPLGSHSCVALSCCTGKVNNSINICLEDYSIYTVHVTLPTDLIRKALSSSLTESVNEAHVKDGELHLWSELTDNMYSKSPEQVILKAEQIQELYAALRSIEARERTYLLYRFGFEDGQEHSVADTAFHFLLSESRAKSVEKAALNKMRKLMSW